MMYKPKFEKPPKKEKAKPKPLPKAKTQIKQRSKKRARAEMGRRPLTGGKCWVTGQTYGLDKHEIFGGCNRRKSIEWGMVIELTRTWHDEADKNPVFRLILQRWGQRQFEKLYPEVDFIKEFGWDYFEKEWEGEIDERLLSQLKERGHFKAESGEYWPSKSQRE